jgi:hypothetical protein
MEQTKQFLDAVEMVDDLVAISEDGDEDALSFAPEVSADSVRLEMRGFDLILNADGTYEVVVQDGE